MPTCMHSRDQSLIIVTGGEVGGVGGLGGGVIWFSGGNGGVSVVANIIGTLSSQDGNAKENIDQKMNFCLKVEFKKWLQVFTVSYGATPQLQHNVQKKR